MLDGRLSGNRLVNGGMLTGDIQLGRLPLTTDIMVSRAEERLGNAMLAAQYMGESRSGILFELGKVDVTPIVVPFRLPLVLKSAPTKEGRTVRLDLAPGLVCEDRSTDSAGLACGYKADARLKVTEGSIANAHVDASYERVQGAERLLLGLGFARRFGQSIPLEWDLSMRGGAVSNRMDGRVMFQVRLVQ